jgi:hypothetical protein
MAIEGVNTVLSYDASGTYTDIAENVEITGPDITVGDVETTHLKSTGQAKTFIPGLVDGGTVQLQGNFVKTKVTLLASFLRATKSWRITFSDGSKWEFSGHINSLGSQAALEDDVQVPFAIKVSGLPVFTAAA